MIPSLVLKQLAVFRGSRPVYSEKFQKGVNIIHGANGSGKSTIADFIFFALGGDLRQWKPHAIQCDFVVAEVEVNDATITLRRDVSVEGGRGMQIFFGQYSEAMAAGPAAWSLYPYRRPASGYNFTQVLFRAMGLPDSVGAGNSNITMHQILRLMYGDQLTPIQRIFRQENFDTWETRQAVGDFLAGVGGYDLYDKQIALRQLNAEFDELTKKLRSLMAVAASYGSAILVEHIEAAMQVITKEKAEIASSIDKLLSDDSAQPEDSAAKSQVKSRALDLLAAKREVSELEDRLETVEYEIEDSEKFVGYLRRSLAEFDDTATTFFSLGQIALNIARPASHQERTLRKMTTVTCVDRYCPNQRATAKVWLYAWTWRCRPESPSFCLGQGGKIELLSRRRFAHRAQG